MDAGVTGYPTTRTLSKTDDKFKMYVNNLNVVHSTHRNTTENGDGYHVALRPAKLEFTEGKQSREPLRTPFHGALHSLTPASKHVGIHGAPIPVKSCAAAGWSSRRSCRTPSATGSCRRRAGSPSASRTRPPPAWAPAVASAAETVQCKVF